MSGLMLKIVSILCLIALLTTIPSIYKYAQDQRLPITSDFTGKIPTDKLIQLIYSKELYTCYFIAELAGRRGNEAVPALLDIIRHGDNIQSKGRGIFGTLTPLTGVFHVIGELKDSRAISVLIELFKNKQYKDRYSALLELRYFGKDSVIPLLNLMKQTTANERRSVIDNIAEIDSPQAIKALQDIASNKKDPDWRSAAYSMAMKENEAAGRSMRRLALKDTGIAEYILWFGESPEYFDDKALLPIFFKYAKRISASLADRTPSLHAKLGIARNSGKAELPLIKKNGLDRSWVMPFVKINCAIEDIESKSEKAKILWQYVIIHQYSFGDYNEAFFDYAKELYYPDFGKYG